MVFQNRIISISHSSQMIVAIGAAIALTETSKAEESKPPSANIPEIVVNGRKVGNSPDAIDRYSTELVRPFGVTIGDVVDRLERRNNGRPFSILINGRRITDISDLLEVPLEALQQVEILPATSAGKYGFAPTNNVLNLVLKQTFSAASTDAGTRIPTEGGGKSANSALRYVNIEKERRFNVSASWQGIEALSARERSGQIEFGPADVDLSPYRTLVPSSRTLSLTAGLAVPVGSVSLNVSSSLTDGVSHQLSRFYQSEEKVAGQLNARAVIDVSHTRSYQLGAGASGSIGRFMWSAEIGGGVTHVRSAGKPSSIQVGFSRLTDATVIPERFDPLVISSRISDLRAALAGNTPLMTLPPGEITANIRVSANAQSLTSQNSGHSERQSFNQNRMKAHVGLDIPLIGPDLSLIGTLGSLSLSLNSDQEWISDRARIPSYSGSLDWQPANFISVAFSESRTRTAPILARTNDPVIYTPGVPVADVVSGEYVLVTRITGGTSDLLATTESESAARVTLNQSWGRTSGWASVEYSRVNIINPTIFTGNPTPLLQSLFPDRFVKDGSEKLTTIDARPFNGLNERREIVRSNLHFNRQGDNADGLVPAQSGFDWDISLTHEWALRSLLRPTTAITIDLLKTPLDAVQGTPRHKVNIDASATRSRMTLRLSAQWRSGVDVTAISDSDLGSIRYAPFWTTGAELSWTMAGNRTGSDKPRALRFWLTVDNIFNKRQSVRDASGKPPIAFQPGFLDSIGRVAAIRISKDL